MTENSPHKPTVAYAGADRGDGPSSGAGTGRLVDPPRPPHARLCDHPGCDAEGMHRAPRARDRLDDYLWFCLDHVRDYNRGWDYYAGMSEEEIEAHRRADTTWRRPTWPLGRGTDGSRRDPGISDPFDLFETDSPGPNERGDRAAPRERRRMTDEEHALSVLDLAPPVTREAVKRRYKSLVKALHPDANGGDKRAEERLKLINQAYATLKKATPI
jgi:hypothetical protein